MASAPFTITSAALAFINSTRPDDNSAIRLYFQSNATGGGSLGCCWEDYPSASDTTFNVNGSSIVVDPASLRSLSGSTIDHRDDCPFPGFVLSFSRGSRTQNYSYNY
ncbi:hypothetical protein K440DRAFT_617680 [Wilcoxina mikolae CBS 423.85]|nr:hypothetical protein K440DRAFT_617680 [Wilcoxina mikolae CBS 423.85]